MKIKISEQNAVLVCTLLGLNAEATETEINAALETAVANGTLSEQLAAATAGATNSEQVSALQSQVAQLTLSVSEQTALYQAALSSNTELTTQLDTALREVVTAKKFQEDRVKELSQEVARLMAGLPKEGNVQDETLQLPKAESGIKPSGVVVVSDKGLQSLVERAKQQN